MKSQSFPLETLFENGAYSERINIVVLGDGYRDHEFNLFHQHSINLINDLFEESPYREYKSYFNAFSIFTPSNVSGAADDPSRPIDNFFGSTFNYAGIERLLVPLYNSKISSVLAATFPEYDQVVMVVNDSRYGGSGGWIATTSAHPLAGEIAIHEIGHSFSNLSDEYYAGDQYARETANMTRNSNPNQIKWRNWLNFQGIGIYTFCCGGNASSWYKPHQNCKMERLGVPFCSVCKEQTVQDIHRLTHPITHYHPIEDELFFDGEVIPFYIDLIHPSPSTMKTEWRVNEMKVNAVKDTLFLMDEHMETGHNTVEAIITDETSFIRIEGYATINIYRLEWQVNNSTTNLRVGKPEKNHARFVISPNPGNEFVRIQSNAFNEAPFNIILYSLKGEKVWEQNFSGASGSEIIINTGSLLPGTYLLMFANDNWRHTSIGKWVKG
ncbi:MAG TPA: M64 family metallopeptidase [Saprospiraceae bacterium]|nr:M64 family metallopeptidase [Saprospiraceae bacterium]